MFHILLGFMSACTDGARVLGPSSAGLSPVNRTVIGTAYFDGITAGGISVNPCWFHS